MDIHKPKPWQGWREFLKEYAIIVAGVLTALGAEQLASMVEWSNKVGETRQGLAAELGEDLGKAQSRVQLAACVERGLDALESIVEEATRTGTLPPTPTPIPPPLRSWATGVWQSAVSTGAAAHMNTDEQRAYARVYQVIDRMAAAGPQEEAVWTMLYDLAGPGRRFDPSEAAALRRAVAQARTLNGISAGFAVRALEIADRRRLPYIGPNYRHYTDGSREPAVCQTFDGSTPSHYGRSPYAGFPEYAKRHPAF